MTTGFRFRVLEALPFWCSLLLPLLVLGVATRGGLWLALVPLCTWALFTSLDAALGKNLRNNDPATPESALAWYRLVTLIWAPIQLAMIFGALIYVSTTDHLRVTEEIGLFFGIGIIAGIVGINYAHELMHQKPAVERWLADILLASVFYGHFRSEHLLVHHTYVGTPRDPVSARYNESFRAFFWRVLRQSFRSALGAEAHRQRRAGRSPWDRRNPFWRYGALQTAMVALTLIIAGPFGLVLIGVMAFIAIGQLEVVNYVEHYGLTRKHLGEGKYEHVKPHHSWNASHKASNWLLINLQRHSDHHYKPDRRFPLLQTYAPSDAPQLPYSYPVMTAIAFVPRLWRRVMNRRVRAWRKQFYPEITDWAPYNTGSTPLPR